VGALYALAAGLWIVVSDIVLGGGLELAQTGKGLAFVGVTAVLLYALVARTTGSIARAEADERRHVAELEALLDEIPALVYVLDREGRVVSTRGRLQLHADGPEARAAAESALRGEEARYECDSDGRRYDVYVRPVPEGAIAVGLDVTEPRRVAAERAALEDRLRESEKLEAIGRLAAGVAHDFNNMLLAIRGYAELAQSKAGDAAARPLREILATADRAHVLTRQLLAFGRRQNLSPERFDLNELPPAAASMLERLVGEAYVVEVERGEHAPVDADRGQFEQALVNLVLNARDAMPDGGRIAVRTGCANVDGRTAAAVGLAPGRYAMLRVSDHGEGIDAATLERIFEPFFTTKDAGRGTGLGLATVHGLVAQSGGAIAVESEPGRGSTFTIYLPLAGDGA
jgi:signal transduction histidine kinase